MAPGARLCWIALLLLRPSLAPADEGSGPGPDSIEQELLWLQAEAVTAVTATLLEEDIRSAPVTVRVVTKRQIRERGYLILRDLLEDLPGVDIQNYFETLSYNRIAIRGVSGNQKFLILQDGVRINSPTNTPSQPIMDNYPLYNAKQVEIVFGPTSSLYGADAFAGVVNIITYQPEELDGIEVAVEGGEFETARVEAYGGKRIAESVSLAVGGHYHDSENPDLSEFYPEQFRLNDLKTFDGTVVVAAADRAGYRGDTESFSSYARLDVADRLTLGWNQSQFRAPTSISTIADHERYGANADGVTRLTQAHGKYRFGPSARLTGQIQLSYALYELLPETKFTNTFTELQDAYKYERGQRIQLEPRSTLMLDRHTIAAGLTVERFDAIPFSPDLPVPYDTSLDPGNQGLAYKGSEGNLPLRIFDIDYTNVGGFLQERSQWTDRFSTILGLRVDSNSDYGTTVNPRVGVVLESFSRTTWKASYGEGFLAPSPLERYVNFGSFTGTPNADGLYESFFFRVPNPDLDPEKLRTLEGSVTHQAGDRLTTSLGVYYSRVDDIILVAPTDPVQSDFVPGGVIFFTDNHDNIGEQRSLGADLSMAYAVVGPQWRVDAWGSYSYLEGELKNRLTGVKVDVPFISQNKVKLGVTLNYRDRFVFTPTLRWIGEANGFISDPSDPEFGEKVASYTILNLFVEYKHPSKRFSVFGRVENLADRRFFNAGIGANSRAFLSSPQDPRWVQAGIRIRI